MSTCMNCGSDQEENSVFCSKCGHKLNSTGSDEHDAAKASGTEETPQDKTVDSTETFEALPTTAKKFSDSAAPAGSAATAINEAAVAGRRRKQKNSKGRRLSRNKRLGIIAGAIALVAIVAISPLISDVVFDSQVRKDIKDQYCRGGIVSSENNQPSYELIDFKIDESEDQTEKIWGVQTSGRSVDYSGTIRNASFETKFSGSTYYVKDDYFGAFLSADAFDLNFATTKPLQGPNHLDLQSSSLTNCYKLGEVSSTKPELSDDGKCYTSVVTAEVESDFWFVTDTCTATQKFELDPNSEDGWQPVSEAVLGDCSTSWDWDALVGTSFDIDEVDYVKEAGKYVFEESNPEFTMTFTDSDDENEITAHYKILFDYPSFGYFSDETTCRVDLEGDAKSIDARKYHNFGEDEFGFELEDSSNGVGLYCSRNQNEKLKTDTSTYAMSVSLSTNEGLYRFELDRSDHANKS